MFFRTLLAPTRTLQEPIAAICERQCGACVGGGWRGDFPGKLPEEKEQRQAELAEIFMGEPSDFEREKDAKQRIVVVTPGGPVFFRRYGKATILNQKKASFNQR